MHGLSLRVHCAVLQEYGLLHSVLSLGSVIAVGWLWSNLCHGFCLLQEGESSNHISPATWSFSVSFAGVLEEAHFFGLHQATEHLEAVLQVWITVTVPKMC